MPKVISPALVLLFYIEQAPQNSQATVRLEFRVAEDGPAEGLDGAIIENKNEKVYLHKEIIITNEDIVEARAVEPSWEKSFYIQIVFSAVGASKMAKVSEANIGKRLAILLDGKVISAPILRDRISNEAQVSGSFTKRRKSLPLESKASDPGCSATGSQGTAPNVFRF